MPEDESEVTPGYFRWVTEHIAGSAVPFGRDAAINLRSWGISAVVSLIPDELYPDRDGFFHEMGRRDIKHKTILIPDRRAPEQEQVTEFLEWVRARIKEGRNVLVHCWKGQGRTGEMIGVFCLEEGDSFEEMINRVGEVESPEQENFLINYALRKDAEERLSIEDMHPMEYHLAYRELDEIAQRKHFCREKFLK